jgi:hypothetical protein
MRTPTRTRIVEAIAAAVVIAATVVPLAAASPTGAKHVQIPARLVHSQEPGSTGYLPPSIGYREPGSTGYVPPTVGYMEP